MRRADMTQLASWCKASRPAEPELFQDRSLCKLLKHLFERDWRKKNSTSDAIPLTDGHEGNSHQ